MRETVLDGEPARTEKRDPWGYGWGSNDDFEHIYAVHDGRAVVVSFGYRAIRLGKVPRDLVQHIRLLFRFRDPIDAKELGLALYANPEEGYELLLPAEWAADPRTLNRKHGSAATAFGRGRGAGTHGSPALTITVGRPDGSIALCSTCAAVARSLTDLQELLVSTPSSFTTGPPEKHSELLLGGELAGSESAGIGNSCLGCPQAYYHVFAIHDGRPIVLAFDYWTVRFASMVVAPGSEVPFTQEMLDAMLQSFRFTDPDA